FRPSCFAPETRLDFDMTPTSLREALARLAERFSDAWEQDEAFREDVRSVLQALATEDAAAADEIENEIEIGDLDPELPPVQAEAPAPPPAPSIPLEKLQELQFAFQNGGAPTPFEA